MGRRAKGTELEVLRLAAAGTPSSLAVTLPRALVRKTPLIRGEHPAIARVRNAPVPPKGWVDDLATVAPMSDRVPWLMFGYHATGARWCIYVAIPDSNVDGLDLISPERREMLAGKPWWEMPTGKQMGRKHTVSAFQWEMYRKHRVDTRPFWCLQGDPAKGGTPAAYSDIEKAMLRAHGEAQDPPGPGTLPALQWSERVKEAVQRRDKLARMGMNVARLIANGNNEALKREAEDAEQAFRNESLKWYIDTFAEQSEFLTWFSRKPEADMQLRQPSKEEGRAVDKAAEEYAETGNLPPRRLVS